MAGFRTKAEPVALRRDDQRETEWRRRSLVRVRRPAWAEPEPRRLRTTQDDISW